MTGPSRDPQRPVYAISVAAELAGVATHTLRLYEDHGLVLPARTEGGTRRYSEADIERITRITRLVEAGVTLAAVQMVLDLQDDNQILSRPGSSPRKSGADGPGPSSVPKAPARGTRPRRTSTTTKAKPG